MPWCGVHGAYPAFTGWSFCCFITFDSSLVRFILWIMLCLRLSFSMPTHVWLETVIAKTNGCVSWGLWHCLSFRKYHRFGSPVHVRYEALLQSWVWIHLFLFSLSSTLFCFYVLSLFSHIFSTTVSHLLQKPNWTSHASRQWYITNFENPNSCFLLLYILTTSFGIST